MESYDLYIVPGGRGRGIAVYIKEDLFEKAECIEQFNYSYLNASKLTFPGIEIIGVYVPPDVNIQTVALELGKFAEKKNCIIIGDFNFDYTSLPNHPIRSNLSRNSFQQHVTKPTHYKGNAIDHIYTRGNFEVLKVARLTAHYSDHFGVGVCIPYQAIN